VQLGHLRAVSIKKTLSTVTQAARKMCSEMNVSVGGGGSAGQGGQRAVWRLGMRVMIVFSPRELGVHGGMLESGAQYHAVGFCRQCVGAAICTVSLLEIVTAI
jgi:hypothetical protein